MNSQKKKISKDVLINIIATAIPVVVLQLFIYPSLAKQMTNKDYGLFLSVLSIINLIPSTMANSLNNVRLLDSNANEGNYNLLIRGLIGISVIGVIVSCLILDSTIKIGNLLLVTGISVLWLLRDYYSVAFRIRISFFSIALSNTLLVVGYTFGFWLFPSNWQLVYICGLCFSLVFIFLTTDMWRVKPCRDQDFKNTAINMSLLIFANLFARITTYADKLLLYPILGGSIVSIYFVATVFGKGVSMVVSPLSSVILSYLAKSNKKNNKVFIQSLFFAFFVSAIGFGICLLVKKPILYYLYPQYAEEALPFVGISTASSLVAALVSIVNPFVLKYYSMKWQVVISAGNACIYVFSCLLCAQKWGLSGFCWAILATTTIKFLFTVFIYFRSNLNSK